MTELHKEYKSIDEMFEEMIAIPWYKTIFRRIQHYNSEIIGAIRHAWQRVFRGYDDLAWWGMDAYLAGLIPKLVNELRRRGNGVPVDMFSGLTPDENHNYSKEDQLLAEARWHNILVEIEEGFAEYLAFQRCELPHDHELVKFNRAFDLFREHFSSLWD